MCVEIITIWVAYTIAVVTTARKVKDGEVTKIVATVGAITAMFATFAVTGVL